MKKTIIGIFSILLLASCAPQQESKSTNKYEAFAVVFQEINNILTKDDGTFWNHSLKGPILLVDPESREIISNQNSHSGDFKKSHGVYIGTLPDDINIANTAIDWNGERWTMVMLPLPAEKKTRDNLIIHELFHRIQPEIGFGNLNEGTNAHLDAYDGRLLLKLELEALSQAIQTIGRDRSIHIANALRFRKERHTSNEMKQNENTLELNEGLAEYTGVMLSNRNSDEMRTHFRNSIDCFYNNKTFVRSFAYQTIPMYGYLLSNSKGSWHKEVTTETNLTDYFENAFSINLDSSLPFETLAKENNYPFNKIQKEEQLREEDRRKVVANYKEIFLRKKTLKLTFENMNISFDPRNVVPIEDIGTVYPTLRVTDNWGILTVKNGALLSNDWQNVVVTEPKNLDNNIITGDGWKLELKEKWSVERMDASYELKKE